MGGIGGLHQRGQILRVHAGLAGHGLPQSVPAFLVVAHVQRLGILVGGDLLNGEGILQLAAAPQGKGGGLLAVFVLPDGIGALLSGQKLGKVSGDALAVIGFFALVFIGLLDGRRECVFRQRPGSRLRRGSDFLGADRQRAAGSAKHRCRQQRGDAPFYRVVHSCVPLCFSFRWPVNSWFACIVSHKWMQKGYRKRQIFCRVYLFCVHLYAILWIAYNRSSVGAGQPARRIRKQANGRGKRGLFTCL